MGGRYPHEYWNKKLISKAGRGLEDLGNEIKERQRQELLSEIKKAYDSGVKLNSEAIQKDKQNKPLYRSAKRFYNGATFWEQALTDAEINYRDVVFQERWDKEKIKKRLIERNKKGKPMNVTAIKDDREEGGLYNAMCRHFDSADDGLRYAEFKPQSIRKRRKPYPNDEIIKKIILYEIRGKNLNESFILSKKNKSKGLKRVYWVGRKRFDGWANAVNTAGIDYDKYRIREMGWDQEKVLTNLLEMYERGEPINASYLKHNYKPVYLAAFRYFDSLEAAIDMGGFNYEDIRVASISLSKEEIISEIIRLNKEGVVLDPTSMKNHDNIKVRRVYSQGSRKFEGGWEETIQNADLDYSKIRQVRKKYSLEELTEKIWELERRGVSLRPEDLSQDAENRNYYCAIMRRRDSWGEFLDEIGIDSSKYVSYVHWKKGLVVLEYLKDMFTAGVVTGVSSKDKKLREAAHRHFGTIENAAEQAGLFYSKSGKISKNRLRENPKILGILYKHNKGFLEHVADRVFFGAINRGAPTLLREDLRSEAFLIFCETLPKKPPKVGIRKFVYPYIYYKLIDKNRKHFKEIYISDIEATIKKKEKWFE